MAGLGRQPPELDLSDAFAAFERTLREALIREARQAVNQAVDRLSGRGLDFTIDAIEFDLVIRHLSVSYGHTDGASATRTARRRTARPRTTGRTRGRPSGTIRAALLDAFTGGGELSIDAIRASLDQRGIVTSDDNLHQHLRRLVTSGALQRPGRGLYRRDPQLSDVPDAGSTAA